MSLVAMKQVIPLYPLLGSVYKNRSEDKFYADNHGATTYVRKDEEGLSLVGVRNPHLGAIDNPMVTIFLRTSLQRECI